MNGRQRQCGFTFVELLVGLAISIVGLLAVWQIMLNFSQQRATITQGMATQNNGVMALYLLERDISQAGYGMMRLQNCDRINYYYNGTGYYATPFGSGNLPGSSNTALTTLPVRLIDGGTGSDIIEVQYGNSTSGVPGTEIAGSQASYSAAYAVASAVGFAFGDRFVANVSNDGNATNICTLAAVTNADPVSSPIKHETTDPYNAAAAPGGNGWNFVAPADLLNTTKPYLANLGSFVSRRYQVSASTAVSALTAAELPTFTANDMVDDIIFLKAQYGLSASCSGAANVTKVVATWADPTALIATPPSACRVIAVRVGVVARSPLLEKGPVDAPSTLTVLPAISGTSTLADPATGECGTDAATREVKCKVPSTQYRYRAYSTIIPLKNVIWN